MGVSQHVSYTCLGVLWSIDEAIPGAQDAIKYLRAKVRCYFTSVLQNV